MSIRKIWIGVLLDDLKIAGGERELYDRSLAGMSEEEANQVVLLLEAAAEGVDGALENACAAFVLRCCREEG